MSKKRKRSNHSALYENLNGLRQKYNLEKEAMKYGSFRESSGTKVVQHRIVLPEKTYAFMSLLELIEGKLRVTTSMYEVIPGHSGKQIDAARDGKILT